MITHKCIGMFLLMAIILLSAIPAMAASPAATSDVVVLPEKQVVTISDFHLIQTGVTPAQPTTATISWDHDALQVIFDCTDDAICAVQTGRDNVKLWKDDCVTVWLDLSHTHDPGADMVMVQLSAGGVVYDTHNSDPGFNVEGATTSVTRTDTGWKGSIRLPWSGLGVPPPVSGEVWGLNLARMDQPGTYDYQRSQASSWRTDPVALDDSLMQFGGHIIFLATGVADEQPLITARTAIYDRHREMGLEMHTTAATGNQHIPAIIPAPLSMKVTAGHFNLSGDTCIIADAASQLTARQLIDYLQPATGFTLKIATNAGNTGVIVLTQDKRLQKLVGNEGYRIEVTSRKIILTAATQAGLFYAVQTLRQLLPVQIFADKPVQDIHWTIPCLHITDKPRFRWRGMMLDSGHHSQSLPFIRRWIDVMALHKLTVFHWRLADSWIWSMEIKQYPKLLDPAMRLPGLRSAHTYTQDDIRQVIQYAARQHVTVVPEIDMPDHAEVALKAYPELDCPLPHEPSALCAGNEKTYAFLENILAEVIAVFPGAYIHIGGAVADSAKETWAKCPRCRDWMKTHALKNTDELQSYFVTRIAKFVSARGRKVIGWQETATGGVSLGSTVLVEQAKDMALVKDLAQHGHDVVVGTTPAMHFNLPQDRGTSSAALNTLENVYLFEPMPNIAAQAGRHILGAEGMMWTDTCPTDESVERLAYPRVCALAEVSWRPETARRDFEQFHSRLDIHEQRLTVMGVHATPAILSHFLRRNSAVVSVANEEPVSSLGYNWIGRHRQVLAEKKKSGFKPDVVLIGDSITHRWGGSHPAFERQLHPGGPESWAALFGSQSVLNLGFGGDRTQNVLWRLDHGEFDGLKPRFVVINIGTNNLTDTAQARVNAPIEIARGIIEICNRVRGKAPGTRVILVGVFPRGQQANDPLRRKIIALNALIAEYAREKRLAFLDIGPQLLANDGSIATDIMGDGMHPTEKGYRMWANALAAIFQSIAPAQVSYLRLRNAQKHVAAGKLGLAKIEFVKIAQNATYPAVHRDEARERVKELDRMAKGLPARDPAASRTAVPPITMYAAEIYVSPQGNDANDGTKAAPVASLTRARDMVRVLKANGTHGAIAVNILPGAYAMSATLALTAQDSGSEQNPIVYRAVPPGKAIFNGGTRITGFQPVTDPAILRRLPAEAKDKVVYCDLRARGITDYGRLEVRGFGRTSPPPTLELYVDGRVMTPARWPNTGFAAIRNLVQPGDRSKGLPSIFEYTDDRSARWTSADDAWLFGYFQYQWADATIKVSKIDPAAKTIICNDAYGYSGSGSIYTQGIWYYAFNLLEEIDQPGEWYLDRNTGMLYLYPPADLTRAIVEIGMLTAPMLTMDGVTNVRLEGLTFDLGRGNGLVLTDCSRCLIAGCTVSRIAGNGISITGGEADGLLGCDIHTIGRYATDIAGGDRATLTPGRHFVENCRIYNFGRIDRTYTSAVHVEGVGNRVAHNLMYDCPSSVIRVEGNDHLIEYNDVHSAVQESDDQGAMELFYNPTYRGVVFRYNRFTNCGNTDNKVAEIGQAGIRLDDAISGMLIYGNIFIRTANDAFGAVQMNGGRDNIIDNNLFIDCRKGISGGWNPTNSVWQMIAKKAKLPDDFMMNDLHLKRYPKLASLLNEPAVNHVWRNIYYRCGATTTGNDDDLDLLGNVNFADKDPGFIDAANGDYRLKANAGVLTELGFNPIPVDEIGLYPDTYRASWPVVTTPVEMPDWRNLEAK